jgi:flagellar basal body-associated protein FliL
VAVEGEKQAETNLKNDLPIFSDEEFVPLDTDIKAGGILNQEEMNKILAGSLEPAPKEDIGEDKALMEGMELPDAPPDTTLQVGNEGEVDLDKLMEDTAVEMGIGDVQKGAAVSGEAVAEPPVPSQFDEVMKKASESLDATMVSSENLETEAHRPVSDISGEDVSPIDVMADMEDEFKPKNAGFFGKIMERVQYLTFFISSYLSRLRGRFFKQPAQQDFDLTEGTSADIAEAHPPKRKITWKLIALSLIILAILAGGTGVIVIAGKKWMSGIKGKEEVVVVKERPSAKRPHVEEKKIEEPVKPLETEKPPEMEKKPAAGEANLTESQQPPQAEMQTATPPPAPPVPEERLARLGILLPVSFSSEETKVMTMNIKLELENKTAADIVKKDPLYYEGILEDSVDQFFRDKFYEDTQFVREKLKEVIIRHLNANIKNGRIKKVDIEELKVK